MSGQSHAMATKPFSSLNPAILLLGNGDHSTDSGRLGDAGVPVARSHGPPGVTLASAFASAVRVCSGHLPGDAPAHAAWAAGAPLGSLRPPVRRAGRHPCLRLGPDPSAAIGRVRIVWIHGRQPVRERKYIL